MGATCVAGVACVMGTTCVKGVIDEIGMIGVAVPSRAARGAAARLGIVKVGIVIVRA